MIGKPRKPRKPSRFAIAALPAHVARKRDKKLADHTRWIQTDMDLRIRELEPIANTVDRITRRLDRPRPSTWPDDRPWPPAGKGER